MMSTRKLPALGRSPLDVAPDPSGVARVLEKIELNCHMPIAASRYTMLPPNAAAHAEAIVEYGQRALRQLLDDPDIKELLP